jgi:hypothetical protein
MCVNCEKHSAAYGGCAMRKAVQHIIKVAVMEHIPRSEAKKRVSTASYADVAM